LSKVGNYDINPDKRSSLGDGGIKAVIFDLDGTIADTLPLCINAFRIAIEPLAGRTLTDEDIIATFGPSEEGTIMALVPEFYDKGLADYLVFYEALHNHCPAPFDGIIEMLEFLHSRGVRIAMVTGKGHSSTEISLNQFGIKHYFSQIETGSPLGPVKAACIEKVLNNWNDLDKNEVAYIGDAPSDIIASRKAGIPVIGAAWAETTDAEKLKLLQPDQIFYSINDLDKWLQENIANDLN